MKSNYQSETQEERLLFQKQWLVLFPRFPPPFFYRFDINTLSMVANKGEEEITNETKIKRVDLSFNVSRIVWKVDFRYRRLAFHGHGLSLLPRFAQSGCFGSCCSRRSLAAFAPINWRIIFMNLPLKNMLSTN